MYQLPNENWVGTSLKSAIADLDLRQFIIYQIQLIECYISKYFEIIKYLVIRTGE